MTNPQWIAEIERTWNPFDVSMRLSLSVNIDRKWNKQAQLYK